MSWLYLAIIAYFLNAAALLVDKFLVSKKIHEPAVYTFYVAVLSALALALWPFSFVPPSALSLVLALPAGLGFTFGSFFMFTAFKEDEVSRVGPLIGGLVPFFSLLLAFWLLGERLTVWEIVGIIILVLGSLTLALAYGKILQSSNQAALLSAFFFGLSAVLTKSLYVQTGFITGLVLMRLGAGVGALLLLLKPAYYRAITASWRATPPRAGALFIFGQSAGALGTILVNYAIFLASVTVVSALQGLQYLFLLILTWLFSRWAPRVLKEDFSPRSSALKIMAIILIAIGLSLLI